MYAVIYSYEQKSIGIVNNIQGIFHKDESTIIHSKDVNTLTIKYGKGTRKFCEILNHGTTIR